MTRKTLTHINAGPKGIFKQEIQSKNAHPSKKSANNNNVQLKGLLNL